MSTKPSLPMEDKSRDGPTDLMKMSDYDPEQNKYNQTHEAQEEKTRYLDKVIKKGLTREESEQVLLILLFRNFNFFLTFVLVRTISPPKFRKKIFQVSTLEALDLLYNRLLQGFLPQFPPNGSLHTLVLSNTNFSGTLPDSIGNPKMLSRIKLPGYNFKGLISNTMANLTQLVYLDLSSNLFTSTIPSFQMSKNITCIDLSYNSLTGHVTSAHFQGLSNLLNIDLAHNSFNGGIHLSFFSLPLLQKIQISNNQFDGPVIGFSNESLPSLDTLDLSRNKLQGSIPSSFFELRSLNVLSLFFNNFSGII
ncbi:hypothetical protein HYC85_022539 [Camellia sinensis]|uniref:Uncharacterized protein n=1 Tax=Camellia sinensis TaxID=4442 RepID=A0A7J7GKM8_CAMSI|nr:hypothetical protein HYC85_022539 [Camellia sinensis]